MIRASIAGGSGFVGGELARWLLDHPRVELAQVTSERAAGQPVHRVHPHLRGRERLRFTPLAELEPCDVLFLALPHGAAATELARWEGLAERIVDCSADFRLDDDAAYRRWYGDAHPVPDRLADFAYGLPEVNRAALAGATRVSGVGCNATAVQLALWPLERAGLLSRDVTVVANVMAGTSEGGAAGNAGSHHPIRSGSLRAYAPAGHRHAAEVERTYPGVDLALSVFALDTVRGALATCHVPLERDVDERELLRAWQGACADEPFLHVVHERGGAYRHPDPKLVTGTNHAHLGFALEPAASPDGRPRVVAMCAIDNLGKGAAGSAVQALNLAYGWEESLGLAFHGIHPL